MAVLARFGVGALRQAEARDSDAFRERRQFGPLEREGHRTRECMPASACRPIYGRTDLRAEARCPHRDFDDQRCRAGRRTFRSTTSPRWCRRGKLGPEPEPRGCGYADGDRGHAERPHGQTCADLDDDGDGVNNCDDKCPGSHRRPDDRSGWLRRCRVVIDLKRRELRLRQGHPASGFDRDHSTRPSPSCKQLPADLRFELAGHTDECGS